MKRLFRILYRMVVAVSLLLCLATVALWARSGWVEDILERDGFSTYGYCDCATAVRSSQGGLQFLTSHSVGRRYIHCDSWSFHHCRNPASKYPLYNRSIAIRIRAFGSRGFELILEAKGRNTRTAWLDRSLTLPLWFPAALFALLPLHFLLRHRRRRLLIAMRLAQRLCPSCGYDLRASGGRCPECGLEHAVRSSMEDKHGGTETRRR